MSMVIQFQNEEKNTNEAGESNESINILIHGFEEGGCKNGKRPA
jgi:hypothetical protein